MPLERSAPSFWHVVRAISRRELGIAARRKMVRLLFLFSLMLPVGFGIAIVVRVMAKEAGFDLGWDPVGDFLQFQLRPIVLLSMGLGAPLVARDRSEDVLYLYAVRPVSPWHYALGKMLAVALPAFLLFVLPGLLIAGLRQGLMPETVTWSESLWMSCKVVLVAMMTSVAFGGVTVGSSAVTKRGRWAFLVIFGVLVIPDVIAFLVTGFQGYDVGPLKASSRLMESLFDGRIELSAAIISGLILAAYGALGAWLTMVRVRKEMIP